MLHGLDKQTKAILRKLRDGCVLIQWHGQVDSGNVRDSHVTVEHTPSSEHTYHLPTDIVLTDHANAFCVATRGYTGHVFVESYLDLARGTGRPRRTVYSSSGSKRSRIPRPEV